MTPPPSSHKCSDDLAGPLQQDRIRADIERDPTAEAHGRNWNATGGNLPLTAGLFAAKRNTRKQRCCRETGSPTDDFTAIHGGLSTPPHENGRTRRCDTDARANAVVLAGVRTNERYADAEALERMTGADTVSRCDTGNRARDLASGPVSQPDCGSGAGGGSSSSAHACTSHRIRPSGTGEPSAQVTV